MNIFRKGIASLALAVAANGAALAQNSDLLVTSASAGGKTELFFEFVNDAKATSMQFDINVKGVKVESVNSANCVAGLPKTFSGACNLKDGTLRVLVYSLDNSVIPSGSIGSISLGVPMQDLAKHASVSGLILAAPDGVRPAGEAFMDLGASKPTLLETDR